MKVMYSSNSNGTLPVVYLLLVFTFYIFTSQGDRTYRRVRYNDPAVDNLLEIVSNEL